MGTIPQNMGDIMAEDYIEGDLTYNVLNKGLEVNIGGSRYPDAGTPEFTELWNKYRDNHKYYIDQPGNNAWMQYYGSDDYWTFQDLKLKLDLNLYQSEIKLGDNSSLVNNNVNSYSELVDLKVNELNEIRNTFLNSDGDKSSTLNKEFELNKSTRFFATKVPLTDVEIAKIRNERLSEVAYKWSNEWSVEQQLEYVMSTDEKYLSGLQMAFKNNFQSKLWRDLNPLYEEFQKTRSQFVEDLNSLGPYGASKTEVEDLEQMLGKFPRWLLENQGAADVISEFGHLLGLAEGSALDRDWNDSHVKQMTFEEWALMGFPEHYGDIFMHVMQDAINDRFMELEIPGPSSDEYPQMYQAGILTNLFKMFKKGSKNSSYIGSLMRGLRNRGGAMFSRNTKGGNVDYKRNKNIGFNRDRSGGASTSTKAGGDSKSQPSGFWSRQLDKYWNTKELGVNIPTAKRIFRWYLTAQAVQFGYQYYTTDGEGYTDDPTDMQGREGYDPHHVYGEDAVNVYDLGIGNPEAIDSLSIQKDIDKNQSGQYDYIEGYRQGGPLNSRNNFIDTFQMYRNGGAIKYQTRGFQFQPYVSPGGRSDASGRIISQNPFYPGYKLGTKQSDLEMKDYRSRGIMKKPRIKYRRGAPIPYQTVGTDKNLTRAGMVGDTRWSTNLLQPNININQNEEMAAFEEWSNSQGNLSRKGNIDFMSMMNQRPTVGPVATGGEESILSNVMSENEKANMLDFANRNQAANQSKLSFNSPSTFSKSSPYTLDSNIPSKQSVIADPVTKGTTLKLGGVPSLYQDEGELPTTDIASEVIYGGEEGSFGTIPEKQPTQSGQSYQGMEDLVLYGDDHMQSLYGDNLEFTLNRWHDGADPDIMMDLGYVGDDWATKMYSDPITNDDGEVIGYQGVMDYQKAWNKKNPTDKVRTDGKFGEQTFRTAVMDPIELPTKGLEKLPGPELTINIERPDTTPPDPPEDNGGGPDKEGCDCGDGTFKPECCDPKDEGSSIEFHSPKNLRWLIPTIGGLSQLIAPLKAQKLEADTISAPIMGREKLERVDFNAQLASGNAETRAMNKFLETSGGGPGVIANKMAAFAANRDSQMKIKSEEATQNAQISNAEASINANISAENAKNVLAANKYNADARMDVKKTKLAAWDAMGNRIAGMAGDTMAYLAERDKARAIAGDPAILDRNRFFGNINNQHLLDENGAPTEEGQKAYQAWLEQQRKKNRWFRNTTVINT